MVMEGREKKGRFEISLVTLQVTLHLCSVSLPKLKGINLEFYNSLHVKTIVFNDFTT
jgi:hypothetical protein